MLILWRFLYLNNNELHKFMTSFSNDNKVEDMAKHLSDKLYRKLNCDTNSFILCLGDEKNVLLNLYDLGFRHLYCMDSDHMIYDRPNYTKVKYLYGDASDTKFPDNMFDAVICPLQIITRNSLILKNVFSTLEEIRRCLKNGGLIIISVPERWVESHRSGDISGIPIRSLLHRPKSLISILESYEINKIENFSINDVYTSFKVTKPDKKKVIRGVNIVCPTLGLQDGISEC